MVEVVGDWDRCVGYRWAPEYADEWLDWIDRRDVDRYVKAWRTAHDLGMPIVGGCRVRWPNGLELRCRSAGHPLIVDRQLLGLVGMTRHTVLD